MSNTAFLRTLSEARNSGETADDALFVARLAAITSDLMNRIYLASLLTDPYQLVYQWGCTPCIRKD